MIYFDNAATTFVYPEVVEAMKQYSTELFFNPSGLYKQAVMVKNKIEECKNTIIKLLGANASSNLVFTASATEANNLALFGFAKKNKKILVSVGEHASVYNSASQLSNLGFDVDFIKITKQGLLDIDDLKSKLTEDVCLVSFMHVSNETGAINDIKQISSLIRQKSKNAIIHCDGVQAFGKLCPNLQNTDVDAYTISSHKIHGPKGVGALWFRQDLKPKTIIFGGGQENGLRSGTENTAGIVGFCVAAQKMYENLDKNRQHIKQLKQHFIDELNKKCSSFVINGDENGLPNILSVSFLGVKGETMLHLLEEKDICVSTGSACSSKHVGNRVLQNMGKNKQQMEGNVRFSFSEFNTIEEVDTVVDVIETSLNRLRQLNI